MIEHIWLVHCVQYFLWPVFPLIKDSVIKDSLASKILSIYGKVKIRVKIRVFWNISSSAVLNMHIIKEPSSHQFNSVNWSRLVDANNQVISEKEKCGDSLIHILMVLSKNWKFSKMKIYWFRYWHIDDPILTATGKCKTQVFLKSKKRLKCKISSVK